MNLPLLFARRYLLAKRSTNAINLITLISIVVIAVVTAASIFGGPWHATSSRV
jgi:lipoprotein-releasing system permease protein